MIVNNKNIFFLFFLIIGLFSCKSECNEVNRCYAEKPEEGTLSIKVTINSQNPKAGITIYNGNYESGTVALIDTITSSSKEYELPIGRYSGTVLYKSGSKSILAVDGDRISTSEAECEDDDDFTGDVCYELVNGKLDLTL